MKRSRGVPGKLSVVAVLVGLVALLVLSGAASAFAASQTGLNWRNEGQAVSGAWTTGEIGPYNEGDWVPFRLTVTNPSNTKSAIVGGFALQVSQFNHGVAIFDKTDFWTGPVLPASVDQTVDDMLRTAFSSDFTLGPGESAVFSFKAHLAETTLDRPAAGMLNGNGVDGFSDVDAPGAGNFGKRVPVKVNSCSGLLSAPAVNIVKTSDAPEAGVRETTMVHYTFVVTNIGDTPLVRNAVTDDVLGPVGSSEVALAPNESVTYTAQAVATETKTGVATVQAWDKFGREAVATDELLVSVVSSARISGGVYADLNRDGVRVDPEFYVPGVAVRLSDASGNELAVAVTDENGAYAFEDLTPGATYTVTVIPPDVQWLMINPSTGSFAIPLSAGDDAGGYDFGLYPEGGAS